MVEICIPAKSDDLLTHKCVPVYFGGGGGIPRIAFCVCFGRLVIVIEAFVDSLKSRAKKKSLNQCVSTPSRSEWVKREKDTQRNGFTHRHAINSIYVMRN